MATIVSPPFVVSEVLKAAGVAQLVVDIFAQKSASEGCATPIMATGIMSDAGGFDATVLVTSHSAAVERVVSCAVSQEVNSMLERLPRTPEESIVIGEASMYVRLLFSLHDTEIISLPVAIALASIVRSTVGATLLPVTSSVAVTSTVKLTRAPRGCVGAEVGAEVDELATGAAEGADVGEVGAGDGDPDGTPVGALVGPEVPRAIAYAAATCAPSMPPE